MTLTVMLPILFAWVVAIASPGPDLLMILRQSSTRGGDRLGARARGLGTAFGIMTGNLLWMVGASVGLGAVVALFPAVLPVLKILGGAFLTWMGIAGLRGWSGARGEVPTASAPSDTFAATASTAALTAAATTSPAATAATTTIAVQRTRHGGVGAAYAAGLATNLANPKALIFFTALFAPFMSARWPVSDVALLLVVLMVVGLAWFCGFALLVTSAAVQQWVGRYWGVIEVVTSALFLLIGAGFLINGVLNLVS